MKGKKGLLMFFAVTLVLSFSFIQPYDAKGASDQSEDSIVYEPTWESLEKHEVPEWYHDAKLGIFIHWGVYSVPGWAPRGEYAEWYPVWMQDPNNPTHQYHIETYGEDFQYEDFIPMWKAENWDPEEWASLFEQAGAKYVVPVGEHHDGFPLWDSELTDWNAAQMGPKRDLIGELGEAVREHGMKYGPSYHAMYNSYTPEYSGPHPDYLNDDYVTFMNAKLKELIDKYKPDLMWLDGDWMGTTEDFKSKEMVAYYYNQAQSWGKEVVVNDRLGQVRGQRGDFYTQEYDYDTIDALIEHKWENTRGMANSFGYNQNEPLEDYLTVNELVEMLVDNVSKNANLLLNVGPKADGTIPDIQKELLLGMGKWLDINGEAIYGTRPFVKAEDVANGIDVRYTTKDQNLYVTMFDWPEDRITLDVSSYVKTEKDAEVKMLGVNQNLDWEVSEEGLTIEMPDTRPESEHAYTIKLELADHSVMSPKEGEQITSFPYTISGTSYISDKVELSIGSEVVTVDVVNNRWNYEVTDLPVGNHQLIARVKDDTGNVIDEEVVTFQVIDLGEDLALNKPANASSVWSNDPSYSADKAVDGNSETRWASEDNLDENQWLEVDFGEDTTFNTIYLHEWSSRVSEFEIQYWDGEGWINAYTGSTIGDGTTVSFPSVTGSKVRLYISSLQEGATGGPTIHEFRVHHTKYPSDDISAADLKTLVQSLEDEGEFENGGTAHSLKVHLTAVNHYEGKELAEKVVRHMESFNLLLDHQKDNALISERAYNILKADTGSLIKKWQ